MANDMTAMSAPFAMQVSYQPEIALSEDFVVFVRPRREPLSATQLASGALSVSWRLGTDYLFYDQPIRPYAHEAPLGEWTALGLTWPQVRGLLTFEIVFQEDAGRRQVVAAGEVLADTYRRLNRRELWVFAWTTPSYDLKAHEDAKPVSEAEVSVETLLRMESGTELQLLTVSVDTVAPPEALQFARFPYNFGATRTWCDVPHGPGPASHFLLPVSDPSRPRKFTMLALGGHQRSTIDFTN